MNKLNKVISLSLAGILTFSGIAPSLVKAEESINTNEVLKDYNSPLNDASYKVLDSGNKDIRKVEFTYDNETAVSEYNAKTGEVFVNGELAAIITLGAPQVNNVAPANIARASSYPVYNIGTPETNRWTFQFAQDMTISFMHTAFTATAVTAAVIAAFLKDQPSQKAAAIISAVNTILASLTSNDKLVVRYTYSTGTNNTSTNKRFMQDLMFYKESLSAANVLFRINYYTGWSLDL